MASELRWILAAICVPLLLVIWWWGVRRSRQTPGNALLRESLGSSPAPAPAPERAGGFSGADEPDRQAAPRPWGVPPFEPLNIRTADFEAEPLGDLPMTAHAACIDDAQWGAAAPRIAAAPHPADSIGELDFMVADPSPVNHPAPPANHPPAVNHPVSAANSGLAAADPAADEDPAPDAELWRSSAPAASSAARDPPDAGDTQRIVTVRVSALGEGRWLGTELIAAFENHGMAYGRHQVFHRRQSDGRSLFCAASLVEPGTFDAERMPREEFRGVTLFAVLPGPAEPLQTFDALIRTAAGLAETLHGVVQDSQGVPLSQQRAHALREDVARFQAALSMS